MGHAWIARFRHRKDVCFPGQSVALGLPAVSLNGSAPRCEHLDGVAPVTARSNECRDCRDRADRQASPAALVVCLICGWEQVGDGATSTSVQSDRRRARLRHYARVRQRSPREGASLVAGAAERVWPRRLCRRRRGCSPGDGSHETLHLVPSIIRSDGSRSGGRVVRAGEGVLDLPLGDVNFIRIDHQARLQVGEAEIVIGSPFKLKAGKSEYALDPGDRSGLGPLLALWPDALTTASTGSDGALSASHSDPVPPSPFRLIRTMSHGRSPARGRL
jgi:hypothetical protein